MAFGKRSAIIQDQPTHSASAVAQPNFPVPTTNTNKPNLQTFTAAAPPPTEKSINGSEVKADTVPESDEKEFDRIQNFKVRIFADLIKVVDLTQFVNEDREAVEEIIGDAVAELMSANSYDIRGE